MDNIITVIPSYEPDARLEETIKGLKESGINDILIIDDGSGPSFQEYFDRAEVLGCPVLKHEVNKGKGAALKTAFRYILENRADVIGCVTADSDGQHAPSDIIKTGNTLSASPQSLVLGCREFSGQEIPFKSKAGNRITKTVFRLLCGLDIDDTQTGLRGIGKEFMKECLSLEGDRFEFETQMLLLAKDKKTNIIQVPINTIYDSKDHHSTHFNAVKDSIKIYSVIMGGPPRYVIVSLLSALLDLTIFGLLTAGSGAMPGNISENIFFAAIEARIVSSVFNYAMNKKWVFRHKGSNAISAIKYFLLVAFNMFLSASVVSNILGSLSLSTMKSVRVPIKAAIDGIIFIMNYYIQKTFIFAHSDSAKTT